MFEREKEEPLGDQFPFVEGWGFPSGIYEEVSEDDEDVN